MRKLILAPMALACLIVSAAAQQAPTSSVDQGRAGVAPWLVTWSGQSVLADLRVAGSPVATGNPVPTSITNFPATQTIAGSVTANIGTTNGLGLDSSLQQIRTALGSPLQAGGNVGISGTLPAYAATPTFNIGTLNGAATATSGTSPYNGPIHDLGTAPAFTRISAGGNTTQAGTINILGCYDSACSGTFVMQSYTAPTGGGNMAISATVITRYWRVQFVNGGTNGAANVYASATAN